MVTLYTLLIALDFMVWFSTYNFGHVYSPSDTLEDKVEVLLAVDAAQVVQEEVVRRAAAAPDAVLAAVAEAGRPVAYWKGGRHM